MNVFARQRRRPWSVRAWLPAALVLLFLMPVPPAAEEDEQPMRTEDVVRMLVRGVAEAEILTAIRGRPALFDVSPDMQEELRLAGVSDALIQAMVDRMADLHPEAQPMEEPEETADPEPPLRIRLGPRGKHGEPTTVRVAGTIDFQLREAWQLDPSAEGTAFEDVAVYLICRTATHVPDHWRSKSPLGRDFLSMPRHRMLAFLSADQEGREGADDGTLELELPPSIEIDLPAGETHDLSLGIALQAAGRYLRWTDDSWDELALDPGGTEIRAEVRGKRDGRIDGLEVHFDRGASDTDRD